MNARSDVVVVGSYPPIPLPAAGVSLSAVVASWADGFEVTVASPRISAAHLTVPVFGVLAGHRLANVRRHTSASRVVLVMEKGFPFTSDFLPLQAATALGLLRAFRQFDHVTILQVGELGLHRVVEARLRESADRVEEHPVDRPGPPGVTPLGPPEAQRREELRQVSSRMARRALGSSYPAVRDGSLRLRQAVSRLRTRL